MPSYTVRPTKRGGLPRSHGWIGWGSATVFLARVEALSHGNQQRVQLAAALVHDPDLLILDEPFAGLDPIATDVMADVLREEAARGAPVLFSSHQLELVEQLCESVAIIDAARRAGPVTHFAELQPTLAELFREVVSG